MVFEEADVGFLQDMQRAAEHASRDANQVVKQAGGYRMSQGSKRRGKRPCPEGEPQNLEEALRVRSVQVLDIPRGLWKAQQNRTAWIPVRKCPKGSMSPSEKVKVKGSGYVAWTLEWRVHDETGQVIKTTLQHR